MWVEYSLEVANYMVDNGALATALFHAMESLANGLPSTNISQRNDATYQWEAVGHVIYFRWFEEEARVYILAVKPIA